VYEVCKLPDLTTIKESFVFMLITDFVLLFTILIGLLRLRRDGVGTCGLGLLLWKQVGCWRFLRGRGSLHPLM
jgi:hypothetical protein